MKLGKRMKKVEQNPFRPNYGINNRRFTVCRITDLSTKLNLLSYREELSLRVDADDEPLFVRELEFLIPKQDIVRDGDLEIWHIDGKHSATVIQLAKDYFEEVVLEKEGKIEKLKTRAVPKHTGN